MKKETSHFKPEKKESIIEVAQRLFGIFGLEKISMREIASELGLSKASLYYYFPDKESLYIAVVDKEQAEFLENVSELKEKNYPPDEFLVEYVSLRLSFFRSLLNLSRFRADYFSSLKPSFRDTFISFRAKELEIISEVLSRGRETGDFGKIDCKNMAALYLDILRGLRISMVNSKVNMYLDQDEYEDLLRKSIDSARIFTAGIRRTSA